MLTLEKWIVTVINVIAAQVVLVVQIVLARRLL
jgi:hypothetical protein